MSVAVAKVRNAANTADVLNLRSAYDTISSVNGNYIGWIFDGSSPDDIIDMGTREWDRTMVPSKLSHGDLEVHARLADPTSQIKLLHVADSELMQQEAIAELVEAVGNGPWVFHLELGYGATKAVYQWSCKRSDISIPFNKYMMHGLSMRVLLSGPRHPIPVLGPI